MKSLTLAVVISLVILGVIAGCAIAFGGPSDPPPMSSINDPFKNVDYSDLPKPSHFVARDGTALTFRVYVSAEGGTKGSVVLVHGSSARGSSMHVLAKAFAAAGYTAYALDIRGHGESGSKGYVAYVGQLEDDLEDFSRSVRPALPSTLAGFSSGGGFALRVAGSARQKLFSGYLLLSPFISQDAPTYRPNSGGWVRVGVPRFIAIALLNAVGVRAFNELPVTKFALNEEAKTFLTSQYSFALAQNFRPEHDYRANIRAVGQPLRLVAGEADEAFYADRFAEVFRAEGKDVPVSLLPGIGHIPLTLERAAVQAAVSAVRSMNESGV
jgi:alpha-beta hydrolase superfamily lysophospholipase